MRTHIWTLVTLLLVACSSAEKKPAQTAANDGAADPGQLNDPATTTTPAAKDDDGSRSQINISDEIKRACGITDAEAFFAFDSANVRPQDSKVLQKLADCFSTGPLKGHDMKLVGHADSRGDEEYNYSLAGRRASNVRGFIATKGLAADRIHSTSRGELDATGDTESAMAQDRRVDVMLGDKR